MCSEGVGAEQTGRGVKPNRKCQQKQGLHSPVELRLMSTPQNSGGVCQSPCLGGATVITPVFRDRELSLTV